MPSLVDTHSHIYVGRFKDDIDAVIERARAEGVEAIIVPATKPSEFDDAFALADRFPEVRVAVGVHPHHAHEVNEADLQEIARIAESGRAVAVGEIGLDYYYEYAPRERQHEVFRYHLRLAKRLGLPAIVHNRESDDDLLRIVEEEQDGTLRFQLHCFSSDQAVLDRALALEAMISFTGNVTYSKGTLDDVVRGVPDNRLMIETDAPYLTPVPHRGKRNEPSYVRLVAEKVAAIRGTTLDAIKEMTTANARRFFQLGLGIILLLIAACASATAQPGQPVRAVDTTPPPPFDKLIGIGGHIASSTYISESTTLANGLGVGFWLTAAPLQPFGVDWLQLDIVYTHVNVKTAPDDSSFLAARRAINDPNPTPPPNLHNTLDISVRATANPRKVITFFGSIGLTYFSNEFGIDRYIIQNAKDTALKGYSETAWGIGGSLGVSLNIETKYGTIAPTAAWYVSVISGQRELKHRQQEFFVSQPRVGLLIYPNFRTLFH